MSGSYNYDTRGASQASQIVNLERMVEERDAEIARLRDEVAYEREARQAETNRANGLRAENERLLGIIASIKAYCDKSKWRMRGRGAPTLQGQDMAYTHVLNYIDQLERNAALRGEGE